VLQIIDKKPGRYSTTKRNNRRQQKTLFVTIEPLLANNDPLLLIIKQISAFFACQFANTMDQFFRMVHFNGNHNSSAELNLKVVKSLLKESSSNFFVNRTKRVSRSAT
jgi:hypothetical protein